MYRLDADNGTPISRDFSLSFSFSVWKYYQQNLNWVLLLFFLFVWFCFISEMILFSVLFSSFTFKAINLPTTHTHTQIHNFGLAFFGVSAPQYLSRRRLIPCMVWFFSSMFFFRPFFCCRCQHFFEAISTFSRFSEFWKLKTKQHKCGILFFFSSPIVVVV